jgi:hypothetical protein
MWPFKSNIPEITTMSEDEDGNIEINHSHGQFKINRKDIVDVQFTKNFVTHIAYFFQNHKVEEILLGIIFFGLPFTCGVFNIIHYYNYKDIIFLENIHETLPPIYKFLYLWPITAWVDTFANFFALFDFLLNSILFSITSIIIGFFVSLVILFLEFYSKKHDIVKIKTIGNLFEYKFNDQFKSSTFKELMERQELKRPNNKSLNIALFIALFIAPIILFFFNWDEPFWFYQTDFFELNKLIDFPISMTNYNDYFLGEPKGFFELFVDGLASFGGTLLFLILCLLGITLSLFISTLLLVVFITIFLSFICFQIGFLPLFVASSLVDRTNPAMKNAMKRFRRRKELITFFSWPKMIIAQNLWFIGLAKETKFDRYLLSSEDDPEAQFFYVLLVPLVPLFPFLNPIALLISAFNKKTIYHFISLGLSIFIGYLSHLFLFDIIYIPCKNLFMQFSNYLLWFDLMIYFSLILTIVFATFSLLIPKSHWEEIYNTSESEE